ncbi:hypothetical protein [Cupriavidus oxalaticus]|uniref:Uncharacterized protein n=1 Tax=Cupriavidus oxalaticus TaxID=96344 RepID=A0A4P7LMR7_9BURK|nr:hypothetical protein [Cupriavidus oxalaticus]QBY56129.1 hypothetical protein E0W60_34285 [Cupriavidus oxalaticus]
MTQHPMLDLFPEVRESQEYWASREFKTWAVTLATGPEKKPTQRHVMYVRARTAESATKTALDNNVVVKGRIRTHARLATWRELGCVRTAA